MSPRPIRILALAAGLASMSLAVAAAAQPQVAPVDVDARAPEAVTLDVTGKDFAAVRPQVRAAAARVCGNAVANHDISFVDESWCSETAASKAMHRFAVIAAHRTFAASGLIVLSAR